MSEKKLCDCFSMTRVHGILFDHYESCEHYKPVTTWCYSVTGGCETDWVIASSADEAKMISKECGCHCDWDEEEDGQLEVIRMSEGDILATRYVDDGPDGKETMRTLADEFREDQSPHFVCSSIW